MREKQAFSLPTPNDYHFLLPKYPAEKTYPELAYFKPKHIFLTLDTFARPRLRTT